MVESITTRSKSEAIEHTYALQSLHNVEINKESILSLVMGESSAQGAVTKPQGSTNDAFTLIQTTTNPQNQAQQQAITPPLANRP
jgi:hypothetical protein